MELANLSPYAAERFPIVAADGEERLLVVVKATLDVSKPAPRLRPEPDPVLASDVWHGEPDASSIRIAADTAPTKPATDVVLVGHAYPSSRDRSSVDVRLRVGPIDKTVRVLGDRRWAHALGGHVKSLPVPFERVPLTWERAFGGTDRSVPDAVEYEPSNPVGVGFRGKRSRQPIDGEPLPNLEAPNALVARPDDRPPPAGFGFVASHWLPRRRHAGTYDERWKAERCPLLPDDFDPRFHQVAPPDQRLPAPLVGGERFLVEHASPSGRIAFELPVLPLDVSVKVGEDLLQVPMRGDTLVIDGDREAATLVWRGSLGLHDRMHRIAWIRVGEAP